MLTKQQILQALQAWINQRPGLEFANYGNLAAYRAELRSIAKDRRDAETLLAAVALRESITAENLIAAFPRAYSGRLEISEKDGKVQFNYCTGQYWPTEYRKAACAVLASVLWDHARASMPAPKGKIEKRARYGDSSVLSSHDNIDGMTPGAWLREHFRREFGRSIQSRWF